MCGKAVFRRLALKGGFVHNKKKQKLNFTFLLFSHTMQLYGIYTRSYRCPQRK
ncbi:hypothetical protein HMPREF9193_02205 [Treponema lecithinolyticum ATCC 700332]|uniref:Uncharacterized protein n=1 Tax=Treponema lecithinolyticum ATCC 700332 TaxID=1321815 RepID=A0ABN0NW24_TRELE|nr:hypothetical protein HMPREF9193_02205 [Treponema lecithinolyticum ATCC 700332]